MCVITGISAILGATLFSVGSTAVTVGGALAATAVVASAAVAGTNLEDYPSLVTCPLNITIINLPNATLILGFMQNLIYKSGLNHC